jgi:outer membrane protease
MKNITVFAVLVIILRPLAPALENSFSIAPRFGLFYGQAEEIVYPSRTNYPLKSSKDLLSQLLWDMKPVYYYGILLDYSQTKPMERWGFFSSLSTKTAIPGLSGRMEDRDWDSKASNDLTDYSSHDNFIEHIFWMDVSAGLSFPLWSLFLLKTNMSFSYMSFGFSGMNGNGVYARWMDRHNGIRYPITDNPITQTYDGQVISYSQEWFCLSPGISLEYYFLKTICLELFFRMSPLNICLDLDNHLTRRTMFKDVMLGGLFVEPGAVAKFNLNDRIKVSLEVSYRYIGGTRGEAYQRNLGTGADFKNADEFYVPCGEAGSGLSIFEFGLTGTIRL